MLAKGSILFNQSKYTYMVVGLVLLIIIFYFLGKRKGSKPQSQHYIKDPSIPGSGGGSGANKSLIESYVDQMFSALKGVGFFTSAKVNAAKNLSQLDNESLRIAHNIWIRKYSSQMKNETLYQSMSNEWAVPIMTIGTTNHWSILKERLKTLGLT